MDWNEEVNKAFEDLHGWMKENLPELTRRGVSIAIDESPQDRDKCSAWLDLEKGDKLARLTVWNSGEAMLEVADVLLGQTYTIGERSISDPESLAMAAWEATRYCLGEEKKDTN